MSLEATLIQALEHSPVCTIIAEAPDGRVVFMNKAAREFRGTTDTPLEGITIGEYLGSWKLFDSKGKPLQADDFPITRALQYGERSKAQEIRLELDDGTSRWARVSANPVIEEGHITSAIVCWEDITEQYKLLRREQLLLAALDHLPVGVCVVESPSTKIVYINRFAREILPPIEAGWEGQPLEMAQKNFAKNSTDRIYSNSPLFPLTSAVKGHPSRRSLVELRDKAGTHKFVMSHASSIRENGELIGAVNAMRDITREKELENLRNDFMSILQHDLRNPLAAFVLLPESLLLTDELSPEVKEDLRLMQESANFILRQLENSLRIYRLENMEHVVSLQSCDLNTRISKMIGLQRHLFKLKKVDCQFFKTSEELKAKIDFTLFDTLIMNLLSNAADNTPQEGSVLISAQLSDDGGILVIVNNPGVIPQYIRPYIFKERFVGSRNGIGLGSYSVGLACRLMGGQLWFESNEDTGTTVQVTLPRGQKSKEIRVQSEKQIAAPPS